MKRFYELKFGLNAKRDYDAKERRGGVIPEFTFLKKGTSPKSVLMQSTEASKRDEKPVEKRIKLHQNAGKAVKRESSENNKPDLTDASALLREREVLAEKLRVIHQLVNYARESDEALLKKVHDFIGSMSQQPAMKVTPKGTLLLKQEQEDPRRDENSNIFQHVPLKQEASFN